MKNQTKPNQTKPEQQQLSFGTDDIAFFKQVGVKVEKKDGWVAATARAISKSKRGFVNPRTGEITILEK